MTPDIQAACEHLDTFGYCVMEDRVPADVCDGLVERLLELHADPECQQYNTGDKHYQTMFGVVNLDDRVWTFASHPDVTAVAENFLGPGFYCAQACSKPTWPGAGAGGLHVDSAGLFKDVPNVPWLINSIWMLTDFTVENGATGIVPMSHKSMRKGPPSEIGHDSHLIKPIVGRKGSVAMWHAGSYHQSRANVTNDIRVGLNIAYYPRWYNTWVEGGHQPTWPETFERMPDAMKRITPHKLGHSRAEVYENR